MEVCAVVVLVVIAVSSTGGHFLPPSIRRFQQDRKLVWETSQVAQKSRVDSSPPDSFDWRAKGVVPAVKDQGVEGSSAAYVAADAIESFYAIKSGRLVDLSEAEVSDCCAQQSQPFRKDIFSCIHGLGGLCSVGSYPFPTGQCHNDTCTPQVQIQGSKYILKGNETDLQRALLGSGPVLVVIDASRDSFQYYTSGIYRDSSCNPSQLDHALLLVGYGVEKGVEYWICQNSWGRIWGESGYIKIERGRNLCGIANLASYPY